MRLASLSIGLAAALLAPAVIAQTPPAAPPATPTDPAAAPTDPGTPPADVADPAPTPEAAEPAPPDPPEQDATVVDPAAADAAKAEATGDGKTATPGGKVPAPVPSEPKPSEHQGYFSFGSYGRMIAATDARGGPGRNADIVAHGSRLDEGNYVELELRRDDTWEATGAKTRLVATLAFAHPVFHYDGNFDANLAARNLYLEERDLGLEGLAVWAGSRMLRGDDIYLLDWWPLDNLNTVGAGVGYHHDLGGRRGDPGAADEALREDRPGFGWLNVHVHGGLSRPDSPFYLQTVERPAPLDQIGSVTVTTLDRQRFIGSVRAEYGHRLGEKAGIKGIVYGESHQLPAGERETRIPREFEALPADDGFVIGGQLGVWTGERGTHLNIYARYASGLAAYGQFATPTQLTFEDTTDGASELLVAAGGNAEAGPVGILVGAYYRSFRDASPNLNFDDVDEGTVAVRPALFFGELGGLAVEGSLQMAQRGVLSENPEDPAAPPEGPRTASMWRLGVVPFLSPAGRGNFSRPQFRFIYAAAFRDEVARQFHAEDDVFNLREVEHFIGVGAEWWFNSTTYSR